MNQIIHALVKHVADIVFDREKRAQGPDAARTLIARFMRIGRSGKIAYSQNGSGTDIDEGDNTALPGLIGGSVIFESLFASRTSGFSPIGPMRAIGISKQLGTLYRAEVALAPGDRVVLATDGIADLVPRHELVEIVRAAASPDVAVEQLHHLLITRHAAAPLGSQGRRDDWTTIVRFFSH